MKFRPAILVLPLIPMLLYGVDPKRTFVGVITDSMCSNGDHSTMRMGKDEAECTRACVLAHGAEYVLFDGKTAYMLSDQQKPEQFAGKKVVVTGSLNEKNKTIQVDSIKAAP